MTIDKLSDMEKSVLLARVIELQIEYDPFVLITLAHVQTQGEIIADLVPNLYDPANMYIAWQVPNWIDKKYGNEDNAPLWDEFDQWWDNQIIWCDKNAQRHWLDKILLLLIKAGMVELNDD